MSTRTDLGDLALDFADKQRERAKGLAEDEAKILLWGAEHCEIAAQKWNDEAVSELVFKDWLRTITTVRVPAQTGALLKFAAKQATADFVSGIFKALTILIGG